MQLTVSIAASLSPKAKRPCECRFDVADLFHLRREAGATRLDLQGSKALLPGEEKRMECYPAAWTHRQGGTLGPRE